MTVTIRQIAEKAGVSRGTVDRVLNGRPGVKPHVRDKILAIADELNYVPNLAAKALAFNKKPIQIGVIMPPKEIYFFEEIRKGIEMAADELQGLGIQLEYVYVDNRRPEEGDVAIRRLLEDGVSGILLAFMEDDLIRDAIHAAFDQGVPVVTLNSDVESSNRLCFVGQDLRKSGHIAAGLMRRMLSRSARVAVVASNLKFQAHRLRVDGFQEGLIGSEITVSKVIEAFDRYEDTYNQLLEHLQQEPNLDGIFMATGDVGGCLDAIRRLGLEGKLRIVSNDMVPEAEQGLKEGIIDFTITQNPIQQGYRSLRILYDYLFSGKKPESEIIYTDTSILIRESL